MIEIVIKNIKSRLVKAVPHLTEEKKTWMYKIINPETDDYVIYGVKTAVNEKITRDIYNEVKPSFEDAKEVFKELAKLNVEDFKFAAFFFLNRYKKKFDNNTPKFFHDYYFPYCQTWGSCDSCCIRVLGPFLAKPEHSELARTVIDTWAQDNNLWIKRASMVILLKIIMVHKDFDEQYVFKKVEDMLDFSHEPYIEKGIGWLLKTCTRYKPNIIMSYLMDNKNRFSRLILRYASEKLPKEKRALVLKKT
jgi:3-methyladenine DNA glycosylase AlkD